MAEFVGEPGADAVAARGSLVGQLLQTACAALDKDVSLRHFFTGGSSPVAARQIPEAARRAAIVAPAARPAYKPVQSSFRSIPGSLPDDDSAKPEGYCNAVERETPRPKAERQRLIASVVSRRRIGSQLELAEALAKAGCPVTQATISRDIRELRLEKTSDALGRPRYVLPGRDGRPDPRAALEGILRQFGVRATVAANLVVVHSELGSAPAIARALDRLDHPKIVGTLAGDDTCLVVTASTADARKVARELTAAIA